MGSLKCHNFICHSHGAHFKWLEILFSCCYRPELSPTDQATLQSQVDQEVRFMSERQRSKSSLHILLFLTLVSSSGVVIDGSSSSSSVIRHLSFQSTIFMSLSTSSIHFVLGLPLFHFPGGFMSMLCPQACSSGRLLRGGGGWCWSNFSG